MPNLPLVLAHGIARFDILRQKLQERVPVPEMSPGDLFHYFKGIKSHLTTNGFAVFDPNQDFAGPVDLRAGQLRDRVNEVIAATGAGFMPPGWCCRPISSPLSAWFRRF